MIAANAQGLTRSFTHGIVENHAANLSVAVCKTVALSFISKFLLDTERVAAPIHES
jgi:hypothetical protein